MREAQPQNEMYIPTECTVQTRFTKIIKSHMVDWFVVVFLMVMVIILDIIHPFRSFIGKNMMQDLKYPIHSNTVAAWAVPLIAVVLPATVFLALYIHKRDAYDLHHALLGLLFAVLISGVVTDVIKAATGWPRPDFFMRCFPDAKEVYDQVTGNVVCHGKPRKVQEGYKSFPSGHASCCFSGLFFLSLYLTGKVKAFDRKGHVAKLCVIFLPLLLACLVAVSRVNDHKHSTLDVFVGALLGIIFAIFSYTQFFPPPYHPQGSRTYSYLMMLESSQGSANQPHNTNQQAEAATTLLSRGSHNGHILQGDVESGTT